MEGDFPPKRNWRGPTRGDAGKRVEVRSRCCDSNASERCGRDRADLQRSTSAWRVSCSQRVTSAVLVSGAAVLSRTHFGASLETTLTECRWLSSVKRTKRATSLGPAAGASSSAICRVFCAKGRLWRQSSWSEPCGDLVSVESVSGSMVKNMGSPRPARSSSDPVEKGWRVLTHCGRDTEPTTAETLRRSRSTTSLMPLSLKPVVTSCSPSPTHVMRLVRLLSWP